jgi:4-amino-4-deoxy-L-arabinose transferase-like glycosyltransferase
MIDPSPPDSAPAARPPETPPSAGLRGALASVFLGLLALAPRLYVALAWAREPVWDGHYYDFGARRIAQGFGYSDDVLVGGVLRWHPWCHYPVGYSGLLGAVYRVFGSGPHVAPVTNAILGALCVVLVHRVGLRFLSPWRAALAALLTAASPELIVYAALLMTEPSASLAPLLAALLASRDRQRPLVGALLAGVALGLGALIRPQTLLAAPSLFFLAIDPSHPRATLRRGLLVAAVATAAALATVAPWTARNCRVMDGCALVSTNAGWNLAIGAFPRATGRFETLRATDGCPVVTGQVQQDRCWAGVGVGYILSDTRRWLGLIPKKLAHTYDHASFAMGYLGEADPVRFPEEVKAKGRKLLTRGHRLLLALAALAPLGAFWKKRGREAALSLTLACLVGGLLLFLALSDDPAPFWWLAVVTPLCALLPGSRRLGPVGRYLMVSYAAVSATHAVFFGEDRYHVFIAPLLALLAASAFAEGDEEARGATGGRLTRAVHETGGHDEFLGGGDLAEPGEVFFRVEEGAAIGVIGLANHALRLHREGRRGHREQDGRPPQVGVGVAEHLDQHRRDRLQQGGPRSPVRAEHRGAGALGRPADGVAEFLGLADRAQIRPADRDQVLERRLDTEHLATMPDFWPICCMFLRIQAVMVPVDGLAVAPAKDKTSWYLPVCLRGCANLLPRCPRSTRASRRAVPGYSRLSSR